MIYTGRMIFKDSEGVTYVTRKSFEVMDIVVVENYPYLDHFRVSGDKCYVLLAGSEHPFILLESFNYMNDLYHKTKFGNHINRIPNFEAWQ